MRALFLLLLLWLTALGWCGVKISFASPGARAVWTAPDLSTPPDGAVDVEATSYEFQGVLNEYLLVLDRATGDIAYKKTRDLGSEWTVKREDYKMIAEVAVRLEFEGRPIESASVRINGSTPKGIGPGSEGTALFRNVRVGEASVEASFENASGRPRVRTQKFPLSLERDVKVPKLVFALTDKVKTLAAPVEPPAETAKSNEPAPKSSAAKPTSAGSVIGNLLVFMVVLAGLTGLLWLALRWISQNQDKAKDAMGKIGVPLDPMPDPQSADPTPPVAPPVVVDNTPKPIVLDPVPPVTVAPVAPLAPAGEPRLVGSGGVSYGLKEGVNLVGREEGLEISLVGETTVSRRHAELVRAGSQVTLKDLGSTNGTFARGSRVDTPIQLAPGDEVQFGAVKMRFE